MDEQEKSPTLEYQSRSGLNKPRRRWFLLILLGCTAFTLLIIFLMPLSYHRSRTDDSRPYCASQMHQIGIGILLYSNEHEGEYRDSLQTLASAEDLIGNVLICPASNDSPSTAPTTQAQIAEMAIPGHVSYIYLGRGLTDKTVLPNQVIVYEPLAHHGYGINVLLGDGHAEWIEKIRAMKVISDAAAGKNPVMLPP